MNSRMSWQPAAQRYGAKKNDNTACRASLEQGVIDHASSAALHRTPAKNTKVPHDNTVTECARGTPVTVVNYAGGWLRVQARLEEGTLTGYVSQELVTYVSQNSFDLPKR